MTESEAIELIENDLKLHSKDLSSKYKNGLRMAINALEKQISKKTDIESDGFTDALLNMGFTKGYDKALDDFAKTCEKQSTTMYGQRYVDMRDIVNISEQLKEGRNNDA